MSMMRAPLFVLLAVLLPSFVFGQSLAEIAAKEKERRQKNTEAGVKPVRTVTEEDVKGDGKDGAGETVDKDEVSRPSSDTTSADPEEQRWRARAKYLRLNLEQARAYLAATPRFILIPTQNVGETRNLTPPVPNPSYEEAQRMVKAAEKAFADFEEEARRARVLPGWLR
jgi:hypothetical protein